MATYFFNWQCGVDRVDDESGRDVADLATAVRVGLREMRGLISEDALEGRIRLAQRIEIEDAEHRFIQRLVVGDAVTFV